jgi:PAS domain S-box-containing protein
MPRLPGRFTPKAADCDERQQPAHTPHLDPEGVMDVIEFLPIPLVIYKRSDGTVLFSNRAVERTLEWRAEKLLNRTFEVLFPLIPDRKRLSVSLAKSGRVCGEVVRAKKRNGDEILASVWQELVVCGRLECVILMFTDVTRQKRKEGEQDGRCKSLEKVLAACERQAELIGFEIHDGFVQEMVTALMHLDACRWAVGQQNERARQELDATAKALRGGVEEARRLIDRVQPPDLESAGLVGAVRQLVSSAKSRTGIPIEFETDLSFPPLSAGLEVTLYRIVQECLTNIRRHSRASQAAVRLRDGERRVEVEVRDNGVGFEPRTDAKGHYGLSGIRHRVKLYGGHAEIISSPGNGTRVVVSLPLEAGVEKR